ncbi:MAG: DinB family protein [Specibacter sp.]
MAESRASMSAQMADISAILSDQRNTFMIPMRNLSDTQAKTRSTASSLTLASLVKHVTATEKNWVKTILVPDEDATFDMAAGTDSHTVHDDETIDSLIAAFHANALVTDAALAGIDLDASIPLPSAPWQPEPEWWSARRILLHVIREISQHSGHADIIREALDGANTTYTMGTDAGMDFS